MAFMMPVVKNDWDIYGKHKPETPSRRSSEVTAPQPVPGNRRIRTTSECIYAHSRSSRSEGPSLSTSPADIHLMAYMSSSPHRASHMQRHVRASQTSLPCSPPRIPENTVICGSAPTSSSPPKTGSQSSLNKFHNRLVDKLRRSLKIKDSSKRQQSADDITGTRTTT